MVTHCIRCSRKGHTVKNCYAKYDISCKKLVLGSSSSNGSSSDSSDSSSSSDKEDKIQRPCVCCGRKGHKAIDCKHNNQCCYRCGSEDHWKITCTATKDVNGYILKPHPIGTIGNFLKSWFWNIKKRFSLDTLKWFQIGCY